MKNFPQTPEALYGRARALDRLSEMQQSNAILKDAIRAYEAVVRLKMNVSDDLFTAAATRCIDRMRFLGELKKIQQKMCHNAILLRNSFFLLYQYRTSFSSDAHSWSSHPSIWWSAWVSQSIGHLLFASQSVSFLQFFPIKTFFFFLEILSALLSLI